MPPLAKCAIDAPEWARNWLYSIHVRYCWGACQLMLIVICHSTAVWTGPRETRGMLVHAVTDHVRRVRRCHRRCSHVHRRPDAGSAT
jgi:hypothetical protein